MGQLKTVTITWKGQPTVIEYEEIKDENGVFLAARVNPAAYGCTTRAEIYELMRAVDRAASAVKEITIDEDVPF